MTLQNDIEALEDLMNSRGWQLLVEVMKDEAMATALSFSDNPNMSDRETGFRAGAIKAAKGFVEMPYKLKAVYMNQLIMERSKNVGPAAAKGHTLKDDYPDQDKQ